MNSLSGDSLIGEAMIVPDSWTFKDESVAKHFDVHVREQLPWYDSATELVAHLVTSYAGQNAVVYDIGCSTGNLSSVLSATALARNWKWYGVDNSAQMLEQYRGIQRERLIHSDATDVTYDRHDVCVCFLSLLFLSRSDRECLLNYIWAKVKPGGAIIVVDKQLPPSGYLGTVLHRYTIKSKFEAGTKAEDIVKKEYSLLGIQIPLDVNELRFHKDSNPVPFFHHGEFFGVIMVKP
jgi:tRNA (cmo5U34)-methyltransferase